MSDDRAIKTKETIKLLKETIELQIMMAHAINDTLSDKLKQLKQINELADMALNFQHSLEPSVDMTSRKRYNALLEIRGLSK